MSTQDRSSYKIRILLLEDQEEDADLIRRALRKDGIIFESRRVDDRDEFEKAIVEFNPDIILSDHSLPQFNSIEALELARSMREGIPFILVTGAVSEEFAAQCIKMGAHDYILKSNLSRLSASLKNAMERHTLELRKAEDEESLRVQNARLTKANREIDSFVYSVSHNLRSPLSSILGLVNVARMEATSGKIDIFFYLNLVEKSVTKLDHTIEEILLYAKNERLEIARERINLKFLVEDCLEKLQFLKGFNRITRQVNYTENAPFFSDPFRLSVILINIVANAIKYHDEGKENPLLRIKIIVNDANAVIEITDNGIGIPADRLPMIFNMFYRGTDRSDGAGLGLYIAREVVEKLGGTIEVTSAPELLTTFTITIPNLFPEPVNG